MEFRGIFPILVTPFLESEKVDFESLIRLIRFMRSIKVQGVTILGVLGEANTLLDIEREEIIKVAISAADGMPVVVGTSADGTFAACKNSEIAFKMGASAIMVTPHLAPNKSDEWILQHYIAISRSTPLPIVLQDHPASSGVHMSQKLILRLIEGVKSIACIKEEAVPTGPKIIAIKNEVKRDISVLTGLGALYGLFDLASNSDGFNTGFAFPEILMELETASRQNSLDYALKLYRHFLPLIVFEQQPGTAIRKEIFRLRGLVSFNTTRHPNPKLPSETRTQLTNLLRASLPGLDITSPISSKCLKNLVTGAHTAPRSSLHGH